ncbi:hypothetical protein PsorP6_005428 [Peronosclerospora sorghi]|uniref:Uncharacterized protein n=1 Tax=Peronosclerospora sorghi TaxID=230839 RepID=A0ACC0W5A0_9STRA|nr:hypothetical protein PsorP6_005428 [Peronosclerospora sorghi]
MRRRKFTKDDYVSSARSSTELVEATVLCTSERDGAATNLGSARISGAEVSEDECGFRTVVLVVGAQFYGHRERYWIHAITRFCVRETQAREQALVCCGNGENSDYHHCEPTEDGSVAGKRLQVLAIIGRSW